ncbi:MAG: DUF3244 domain-containing protein [Tannerellaceae bacterium]|nr:DUF3244 domain-containing protein [Tannerellaceae bacterium]
MFFIYWLCFAGNAKAPDGGTKEGEEPSERFIRVNPVTLTFDKSAITISSEHSLGITSIKIMNKNSLVFAADCMIDNFQAIIISSDTYQTGGDYIIEMSAGSFYLYEMFTIN